MDAKKCDRCGRFYEEYGEYKADCGLYEIEKSSTIRTGTKTGTGKFIFEKHFDLCPLCMDELNNFLGYEKPETIETAWQSLLRKVQKINEDQSLHEEKTNEQI